MLEIYFHVKAFKSSESPKDKSNIFLSLYMYCIYIHVEMLS